MAKIQRSDEAADMVSNVLDLLSGSTHTQVMQVCANIVGAAIVESAGPDRQAVLDQSMAFGNVLGRVIETTLVQLEEGNVSYDGTQEKEDDEGDAGIS